MSEINKVIIASSLDGANIVQQIKAQIIDEPIKISEDWRQAMNLWDAVVILFVITKESIKNLDLIQFVQQSIKQQFPLVGIVNDTSDEILSSLPDELVELRNRNAVGLNNLNYGSTVLQTVRGYLGLESFTRHQKVFISYRRLDTKQQADAIYKYLWEHNFQVFLDTHQIEGGAIVQEQIVREILEKDLVLLLDSPNINSSSWVSEEINTALAFRIPVCIVKLQNDVFYQSANHLPQMLWNESDDLNLHKIKLFVSRRIASRESFDQRVARTVHQIPLLDKIKKREVKKRSYILSYNNLRLLLQYENSRISLERLHLLYEELKSSTRCKKGILVCGDYPIPLTTEKAVHWARGRSKLDVICLLQLSDILIEYFQEIYEKS